MLFVIGTMVGCFAAFVVFTIFFVGGRRERENWYEDYELLHMVANSQGVRIEILERSVELAAMSYIGKFDDCRRCSFACRCGVHNQDDVDNCIETLVEGWKNEARCSIE